jgi:16S rRNA (cytosine1402-N4)-methyltransferase
MPDNFTHEYHIPVLPDECIRALAIKPAGIYVDCTLGGGGHFQAIVDQLNGGVAIGIDRDPESIAWCSRHIDGKLASAIFRQARFSEIADVLQGLGITAIDGVLMDLGLSTRQITSRERGFSYMKDVRLDMRMNPADAKSAADILRESSEEELTGILADYGEIHNPARMAGAIKRYLKTGPLTTSEELKSCLQIEYGPGFQIKGLAKLFQALRIAVNGELTELRECCEQAVSLLKTGGRLAVISYHSLEDRFVKNFMRDLEKGCLCPPSIPVCICGKKKKLKRVTVKATIASADEINRNPASRSARLRAAEKIDDEGGL